MRKIYLLFVVMLIFIVAESQNSLTSISTKLIDFRFIDSETGFALKPDTFTIKDLNNNKIFRILKEQIQNNGTFSINFDLNKIFTLNTELKGYKSMKTQITVDSSLIKYFRFYLSPMNSVAETNSEHVKSLHRQNATVIVGFIVDDKSGKPIKGVCVSTNNDNKVFSNVRGYYILYVPIEEEYNMAIIYVNKKEYIIQKRKNLDVLPNGDIIMNIRLIRGTGEENYDDADKRIMELRIQGKKNCKTCSLQKQVEENSTITKVGVQIMPDLANTPSSVPCSSTIRVGSNCSPCTTCGTVNVYNIEDYCKHVLPYEWLNCWGSVSGGMNSLQAGAVAIRSYGLWRVNNPLNGNYDICDNACCQVYGPNTYSNSSTAVDNTVGNVLVNGSNAIQKTEYGAEQNGTYCNNNDCYIGDGTFPCVYDVVCCGKTYNGNGRGMCQNGSARWATGLTLTNSTCNFGGSNGYGQQTWQWILSHYYPSWTLTTCTSGGCTPPAAPTLTFGTSSCPGTAGTNIYPPGTTLSWNMVSGATGYKIFVSKYPYGSSCLLSGYNPYPCSNYQGYIIMSTALEPGMLYRWNMNATSDCSNSNCDSPISTTNYFYVPPTIFPSNDQTICQGSGVSFSTTAANACSGGTVTYQWYRNSAIIPGATNTSYYATLSGTYYIQFNFSGSTYCSSSTIQSITVNVTVTPIPGQASVTGTNTACQGASNVCFTASSSNATSYNWTVPSGWTITSGQGTTSMCSIVGSSSGNVCATPSNNCGSGTQGCITVAVTPLPGIATVTGSSTACQGATNVCFTASSSNATSYNWTVPSGWTITSGQGTASMCSIVGSSSGNVCATPSNNCGSGPQGCKSVTVTNLPGAATVTGSSLVCQGGTNVCYTAVSSNATSFTWTVPSGWTIISGQGTSSMCVTVGSISGSVCATPSNNCGSGAQGCITVTVTPLPGIANVTGTNTACQGASNVCFTASSSNATSYNWTVPSGWTITSGQGTALICTIVGSSSGNVCATPANNCGLGPQGCMSVTITVLPGTASISGSSLECQGSTNVCYSASSSNATSYNWIVPSGWTITSGQGTALMCSIVGSSSGNVCATPSNNCGAGIQGCISVTVTALPGIATVTGSSTVCQGATNVCFTASSSNATTFNWTVPSGWTIISGQGTASMCSTVGTTGGSVCATPSNNCGSGPQGCINVSLMNGTGTAPNQPGPISGPSNPISGTIQSYSISSVIYADSYTWTIPSSWTINSGQGSTNIIVTVGSISGNVCVSAVNYCGASPQECSLVNVIVGMTEISSIKDLSIYPNPNTGEFILQMEILQPLDLEIELLTVTGKVVFSEKKNYKIGIYKKSINFSQNSNGCYVLKVKSDMATEVKSIIKE